MNEQRVTTKINLDKCHHLFDIASNRALYFSALAEASVNPLPVGIDWNVETESINHLVASPSADLLNELKGVYPSWVNVNSVREMIESYFIFLDKLYRYILMTKDVVEGEVLLNIDSFEEEYRKFRQRNLSDKVKKIKDAGVTFEHSEKEHIFNALRDVRHCLAHNAGFITNETGMLAKSNKRKIIWYTINVFIVDSDGKRQKIKIGKQYSGPGSVELKISKRERTFKVGQAVDFSRSWSTPILWSSFRLVV